MTSSIQPPPLPTKEQLQARIDGVKARLNPSPNVATKHDADKPRPELLPADVLLSVSYTFAFGAKKYSDRNWEQGFAWSRLVGALFRHVYAWMGGERLDPESGRSHLDHALAMLLMLRAHEIRALGEDDLK